MNNSFKSNILESSITQKSMTNSKMKKFWTIFVTLLILLIPIAFLNGIIDDRENYKKEAVESIASSWGSSLVVDTPIMYFNSGDSNAQYLELNDYNADVKINTDVRKKGIYKVPVYTAEICMKGNFKNKYGSLSNKELITSISVNDSSGFVEEPVFKIGNFQAQRNGSTSVSTKFTQADSVIPFEISYKIRGLNDLYLGVDGLNNKISISGNWDSPSFVGHFLPTQRSVDNKSFSASWSVPRVAVSSIDSPSIGVSLLMPVDNYRMAERTLKYAFLFLSLTFLSYFIFEIVSKDSNKIHPLQYCLLGAGMQIFYLLLVSLSEFLPFGLAYAIAAFMIIALIGVYTYFVITKSSNKIFAVLITFLMGLLYMFLYVLLLLQDFSLLLGSFGMFIIIAIVMYVTRNVDWYGSN